MKLLSFFFSLFLVLFQSSAHADRDILKWSGGRKILAQSSFTRAMDGATESELEVDLEVSADLICSKLKLGPAVIKRVAKTTETELYIIQSAGRVVATRSPLFSTGFEKVANKRRERTQRVSEGPGRDLARLEFLIAENPGAATLCGPCIGGGLGFQLAAEAGGNAGSKLCGHPSACGIPSAVGGCAVGCVAGVGASVLGVVCLPYTAAKAIAKHYNRKSNLYFEALTCKEPDVV